MSIFLHTMHIYMVVQDFIQVFSCDLVSTGCTIDNIPYPYGWTSCAHMITLFNSICSTWTVILRCVWRCGQSEDPLQQERLCTDTIQGATAYPDRWVCTVLVIIRIHDIGMYVVWSLSTSVNKDYGSGSSRDWGREQKMWTPGWETEVEHCWEEQCQLQRQNPLSAKPLHTNQYRQ